MSITDGQPLQPPKRKLVEEHMMSHSLGAYLRRPTTQIIRVGILVTALSIITFVCPLQASALPTPPLGDPSIFDTVPQPPPLPKKQDDALANNGKFIRLQASAAENQDGSPSLLLQAAPQAGIYYAVACDIADKEDGAQDDENPWLDCKMRLYEVTVSPRRIARYKAAVESNDPNADTDGSSGEADISSEQATGGRTY